MEFEEAIERALRFRDERNWSRFHNPKDLSISICLEASELLEVFQWSGADLDVCGKRDQAVGELADVVIYCIYLAEVLDIDLANEVSRKISINASKYPVEKAKDNARKYTDL